MFCIIHQQIKILPKAPPALPVTVNAVVISNPLLITIDHCSAQPFGRDNVQSTNLVTSVKVPIPALNNVSFTIFNWF